MRTGAIVLGLALLAGPAQAGQALEKLHRNGGEVVIEYERAVAGDDEFSRLAREAPAAMVAVSPVAGATEAPARAVAAAYAAALQAAFPGAVVVDGDQASPPPYVAQVDVSRTAAPVEVTEKVYGVRQTGVGCRSQANSVECTDRGGAPIAQGTRSVQHAGEAVEVTIRLYRQDPATGARTAVFEDAYSIRYPETACRHGHSAAATVAAALAANALSPEPVHIRFHSDPRRLRCGRP